MKIRKIAAFALCALVSAYAFTGCGNENANQNEDAVVETLSDSTEKAVISDNENDADEKESVSSADTQSTSDSAALSEEQVSEKRVIASSVAVVQILDAMNVAMVGVPTSSYELPESVKDAARIGNPMSPDLEIIASLEPDVIVSVDTLSEDLQAQFDTLKIKSVFVNLSSYSGLKESIEALGKEFGKEDEANEILSNFKEVEEKIAKETEGKESPKVLIIFGVGTSFMVASEDTYVGDLVKMVGATNVISDAPASFSPVDMEYLASQNPDYILFMCHANPEASLQAFKDEIANNAAWQNFDAVVNNRVVALPTGYFGMSANLEAGEALEQLVEILY